MEQRLLAHSHYATLQVGPSAAPEEIRRAYRELSKLYHPDTTQLPAGMATEKFQKLTEAYDTLIDDQRRREYDRKVGYRRPYFPSALDIHQKHLPQNSPRKSSAYLDPSDRPLSGGELLAMLTLALALLLCFALAVWVGISREL